MSQDADTVKKLVALKQRLEKKVSDLESELDELRSMLEAVNSILLEKGFRRGEITSTPAHAEALSPKAVVEPEPCPPSLSTGAETVVPLKTVSGELLADICTGDNSLRVVMAEGKDFDVNTPPFTQFLVERVLMKMQERDSELARTGHLKPDKIFSYNIVREGDIIREIDVRNFDADRLRELKSSVRWTLEKMYEKMKGSS
jgi:hypothetical protein